MPRRHTPTPVLSAVFAALLGVAACNAPGREAAVRVDGGTLELQRIVDEVQRQSGVPALAAAWARSDGAIHAAIAGTRTVGNRHDRAQIDDRVRLGLVSNQFVAIAAVRVMKRTPLRWDTSVEEFLPDLVSDIRPEYRRVTVAQLLAHGTTIPPFSLSNAHELAVRAGGFAGPRAQRQALARWALAQPPGRAAGVRGYPDVDYLVLAHVAEHGTDAFEELMHRVIASLKCGAGNDPATGPVLPGHIGTPMNILAAPADGPDTLPAGLGPVADLRCSISSLGQFARENIRALRGLDESLEAAEVERALGPPASPVPGLRVFRQTGGATSFAAQVTLSPDEDVAIVVAANAGFGDRACERVTAGILESLRAAAR